MLKIKAFIIVLLLSLSGCTSPQDNTIKIVTNSWIGYSPLFYAKEKGWLKEIDVELSLLVSLGESMMSFRTGRFDGITGTQYEYQKLNSYGFDLVPIIMFDRSNGGDVVMSNVSIATLKQTTESIDVYLEVNSINTLVFEDFKTANGLSDRTFHFINKDPLKIVTFLKQNTTNKPTIVVTYTPYNFELVKSGFQVIDSTEKINNILVLDALYVENTAFINKKVRYQQIKSVVDRALNHLKSHPKDYYQTVKPYLENPTYEEFTDSLKSIEWLNESFKQDLIEKMSDMNFPTRNLL